ncbi:Aste57867_24521 [Aphanomyces stellatus]|uniref:Aste57867_24521 protein n=1 Tax=Aphanomyces stellatus TaxID=120398 RepID=A0A485LSJ3_9STRA|nr:hypothetical protein As57867_024444 [Aphanomyces stellatus]VFU01160.1 Aste57867_24521 [Aphanomyces stellatus]
MLVSATPPAGPPPLPPPSITASSTVPPVGGSPLPPPGGPPLPPLLVNHAYNILNGALPLAVSSNQLTCNVPGLAQKWQINIATGWITNLASSQCLQAVYTATSAIASVGACSYTATKQVWLYTSASLQLSNSASGQKLCLASTCELKPCLVPSAPNAATQQFTMVDTGVIASTPAPTTTHI